LHDEIHTKLRQRAVILPALHQILPLLTFDDLPALEPPVSLCDRPTDIFQFLE